MVYTFTYTDYCNCHSNQATCNGAADGSVVITPTWHSSIQHYSCAD
jgi:hypothetical protein